MQHIIETITGQSLRDFAKENIFDILGMQYTDYLPTIQQQDGKWINTVACPWMDRIAPTEKQKDGSVLCGQVHDPLARILNGGISGNAGIFSNANDIGILAAALLNGGEGYTGTSIIIDPDNDTAVILLVNAVHPEDRHSIVRLRSLVANAVAASICPPAQVYTDHYYKRFLQFETETPISPKDIVMVGNSLTENGGNWSKRLNKKNIRNRGITRPEHR